MVMYPFPTCSLSTSFLPTVTYIVQVLTFKTESTRKLMFMGQNIHTNRLGLYFVLQVRPTSLSLLSKMLVKFCVKIDHTFYNYSCT
jgi:hypothetical protein